MLAGPGHSVHVHDSVMCTPESERLYSDVMIVVMEVRVSCSGRSYFHVLHIVRSRCRDGGWRRSVDHPSIVVGHSFARRRDVSGGPPCWLER